jgi:hypothetical protein
MNFSYNNEKRDYICRIDSQDDALHLVKKISDELHIVVIYFNSYIYFDILCFCHSYTSILYSYYIYFDNYFLNNETPLEVLVVVIVFLISFTE